MAPIAELLCSPELRAQRLRSRKRVRRLVLALVPVAALLLLLV